MGSVLTRNLILPISHFRRRRRSDMRDVFENFETGLAFRRTAKKWTHEQKIESVLRSLRQNVRRAASETPYYKRLFRRIGFDPLHDFGFEDFAQIPVLQREDIHKDAASFISPLVPREKLLKDATGGTSGVPTEVWLGPEERGWAESAMQYSFEKVGVPPGSKMGYLWGHHLDPQASERIADRVRSYLMNVRYFDCFRLSAATFRKYHAEFERYRPDCIVAYATSLGYFAEYLRENGIRPRKYPRICFVTGAEKLLPHHRQAIHEVFGSSVPVHERYGGRDFGLTAIQTSPATNLDFEVDWAWALLEPETDEEHSPILVTKLHADAMPMLRYRVGDIGEFGAGDRPGNPVFVFRGIQGRDAERIWLPDGRWVAGTQFPHLMKSFPVREFMLVQNEDYSVELLIVPKPDFSEAHRQQILGIIAANVENLRLNVRIVDSIERTKSYKWRPVVSRVQRGDNIGEG